jgi:probable rRNA maturation factor
VSARRKGPAAGLFVAVSTDDVRAPVARATAAEIVRRTLVAERVGRAMVSVTFVSPQRIAVLNREYLGHRGATDVISFGFARRGAADPVIGDVYIAPAVARENAKARGTGVREEIVRLLVHGTLHVLGHDHPEGDEEKRSRSPMWRRQERLVARLRPLIARRR